MSASAGFAVQGLSFAAVIAQVPAFRDKYHMDDTQLTLTLAVLPIIAGVGSVLAGVLAPRIGSAWVLRVATATEAVLVAVIGAVDQVVAYYVVVCVFGMLIGAVDASMNMQGTAVQRRYGRSILASCHAWWSVAGIAAAAGAIWFADHGVTLAAALAAAGAAGLVVALAGAPGLLSKAQEAEEPAAEAAAGLTQVHRVSHRARVVTLVGIALMVMFIGDSAATSYGTVFMEDALGTTGGLIRAGLFAYLSLQLVGRIVADRVIGARGATGTLVVGAVVATLGFAVVAVSGAWGVAVAGFALMGLGLSVVVPLTFSAADGLDPAGSGAVIARVNLFNYAGVIIGSAAIGVVGGIGGAGGEDYPHLRLAFAIPAILVLLITALAPAFRVVDRSRAAAHEAASARAAHAVRPGPAVGAEPAG
ncbi:MAG TPA: MFS transporter [Micromonosporaceae bacterium]